VVERDLWNGADVRWVGPETSRAGIALRPGDRAVVIDAGRHHVTSFGSLYAASGTKRPRPGRGVTVRLHGGTEVTVPRRHLELLPPGHPLTPEPDGGHAAWWLHQLDDWGPEGVPVSAFVPASLPAVCQVLHPWFGSDGEPIRWHTLADDPGVAELGKRSQTRDGLVHAFATQSGLGGNAGELDAVTAAGLVDVLGRSTTTPDDVFVAVWEGWGDVPPQRFPGAARLNTPSRGHFLLRGPLTGVLVSVTASGFDRPTAGLWWPADLAWFVATEIDLEWTFVAGDTELVERLLDDERLEVIRTTFDAPANHAAVSSEDS
jgi:hypothetical protein